MKTSVGPTPVALLALLALLGFGMVGAAADPSPAPSAAASPGGAAATATVDTKNFSYAPTPLTIAAGTTVTFRNSDLVSHTVTSNDKDGGKAAFDSGELAQNATWAHTFATPGTYAYFCSYHTYMKGTIVVK